MTSRTALTTTTLHNASPSAGSARRRWLTALLVTPLVLAVTLLAASPAHAQLDQSPPPQPSSHPCIRRDVSVTLTPDAGAARYRVAGWLCRPRQRTGTVQLLVSGLTYTHRYWMGNGQQTSYVDAALAAGHAVYAIDRIGTGDSDRPPAEQVTTDSEAYVNHQLVQALRNGPIGRYRHVVGVGHSFGSVVWMAEAAGYHDVNALVLTGLLHQINSDTLTAFVQALHPAGDDPAFAGKDIPDGYLTTQPGTRAQFFLNTPDAAPGAAAWDETTKATATTGELTFTPDDEVNFSRQIHVPVLTIVGTADALFCGTGLPCATPADLCQRERPTYPSDTPLYTAAIPRAGHSINLHRNAGSEFRIANQWISQHTSTAATAPRVTSC